MSSDWIGYSGVSGLLNIDGSDNINIDGFTDTVLSLHEGSFTGTNVLTPFTYIYDVTGNSFDLGMKGSLTGQYLSGNTGGNPSWRTLSDDLVTSVIGATNQIVPTVATTGDVTIGLADPCVMPGDLTCNGTFTLGSTGGMLKALYGAVSAATLGVDYVNSTYLVKSAIDGLGDFSTPRFADVRLTDLSASGIVKADVNGLLVLTTPGSDYVVSVAGTSSQINITGTDGVLTAALSSSLTLPGTLTLNALTSGLLKVNGAGQVQLATGGTDYVSSVSGTTNQTTVLAVGGSVQVKLSSTLVLPGTLSCASTVTFGSTSAMLKRVSGVLTDAVAGTDYLASLPSSPTFATVTCTQELIRLGSSSNASTCLVSHFTSIGSNLRNVLIGRAGSSTMTGTRNTVIGVDTGTALTTGTQNILIGDSCAPSLQTGSYNVILGANGLGGFSGTYPAVTQQVQVGVTSCVGTDCTAVGYQALHQTTAAGNTAVGSGAGRANTTGTSSVFIGMNAGYGTGSGAVSDTVCIGANAMRNLTGGTTNTCIGSGAGYGITTGSRNVCIGYQAGKSALTVGNDQLWIHNADATNAVSLLYGDFAAGTLRVNTKIGVGKAPTANLDVSGTAAISGVLTASGGVSATTVSASGQITASSTIAATGVITATAGVTFGSGSTMTTYVENGLTGFVATFPGSSGSDYFQMEVTTVGNTITATVQSTNFTLTSAGTISSTAGSLLPTAYCPTSSLYFPLYVYHSSGTYAFAVLRINTAGTWSIYLPGGASFGSGAFVIQPSGISYIK